MPIDNRAESLHLASTSCSLALFPLLLLKLMEDFSFMHLRISVGSPSMHGALVFRCFSLLKMMMMLVPMKFMS